MNIEYLRIYLESTQNVVKQMMDIIMSPMDEKIDEPEGFQSLGVASVITFSGKIKGRLIIDMCPEFAFEATQRVMGEPCNDLGDKMLAALASEMNNTIAGDANTKLNDLFNLGLRLAPPIVATGTNMVVSSNKMDAVTVRYKSEFGESKINVGFQVGGA